MRYWLLLVLTVVISRSSTDDGSVQIVVEHTFGGQSEFTRRGVVRITKSPSGDQTAEYIPGEWTQRDQQSLINAAKIGAMYKIRASAKFGTDTISGDAYVMSSTPACYLVQSHLTDSIHLAIDSSRQRVLSISDFPFGTVEDNCQSLGDSASTLNEFNTSVRLVDTVDGPIPETQAYLQKVEREKQERARGEQGDNRSFLAKYWMYIVPVVIVLMLSSAMNPEAQGGGGNRH